MCYRLNNEELKDITEKAQRAWDKETDPKLSEAYKSLLIGATDALIRQVELEPPGETKELPDNRIEKLQDGVVRKRPFKFGQQNWRGRENKMVEELLK